MWFGRVACRRVKPCPVCLLTVSLFMGQVSCVYWGHCGQGAQEDEPEKPLEEQGRWGRGSQCVPCRLLVVPGSRGEGPPHPRAESKVCGLLVSLLFSRSVVSDAVTPRTAARPASLSITNSWSLLKLTSIESVMPSNHLLCRPLSSHLQSFPASGSFQMSQLFASGAQSTGASASTSVLPVNIQD